MSGDYLQSFESTPVRDEVVLLDEAGNAIGSAPREGVHVGETPLHLAFSCHLTRADGRVLLTRRALTKRSWPGVWTNSFCGHPRPGESLEDAIVRHARHELGITPTDIAGVLPHFRYRAVDAGGTVENEICPVHTAFCDEPVHPNPDEVMEHRWAHPADLAAAIEATPWAFSPWLVLQSRDLDLYRSAERRC
ncbi:isopentenyl-diphosphate Delta-isomerase [Enemella sp. A6]|uniref:isopentenyl-diphosphate Delta-isomerase n=1 Tax=Enemella sp. A6 TaxID=3440152 RepID=UPI003EBD3B5E